MKKRSIFLATVMASGVAMADVVWQNDFSGSDTFFDPPVNPVDMHNGREDAWLGAGTASITAGEQLRLASGGSGQARGLVRAMPAANNPLFLDTTGDASFYRFSFDVVNIFGTTDFNVEFLRGTRDDDGSIPEANTYNIDLLSALNADLTHTTTGSGTFTSLSDTAYTSADVGNTMAIDFEWDGTGDLVMVFDTTGTGVVFERVAITDNWQLEIIPEPATLGMFGLGALALFCARRFKRA